MRSEAKSRTAAALVSLLMGCWATVASAGGEPDGGVSLRCDPCTEPNGRGIYIADPLHYCIRDNVDGVPMRFCPEALVEVPAQGSTPAHVELDGSYFVGEPLTETKLPVRPTVSVRLQGGKLVPLLDVGTETTTFTNSSGKTEASTSKLTFYYKKDNLSPQIKVSSEHLHDLTLHILSPFQPRLPPAMLPRSPLAYLLNFKQVGVADAVTPMYRYSVSWMPMKPQAQNFTLCSGGQSMSVLPGRRVSGTRGTVTNEVTTTTMACATGAIVQCMTWGYRPENLKYKAQDQNSLMGACIQAKRAAYFGGPTSYTQNGHSINMRDFMPIPNYQPVKRDSITKVEAIWTAEKAYCVNKGNRRVNPPLAPEFPQGWESQVRECGDGPLPADWAENGVIVTGPAEDTTSAPGQ